MITRVQKNEYGIRLACDSGSFISLRDISWDRCSSEKEILKCVEELVETDWVTKYMIGQFISLAREYQALNQNKKELDSLMEWLEKDIETHGGAGMNPRNSELLKACQIYKSCLYDTHFEFRVL